MKRTTVILPDDVAALLELERRRRDVSIAQVVREALEAYLSAPMSPKALPFVGLGRSGQRDTARNIDAILEREWVGPRGRR